MTEPDFSLTIPRPADWINANGRIGWRAVARLTAEWRKAGFAYAKQAGLPALGPSRVIGELHVNARRRVHIDPGNFYLVAKAAVDGLVDAGIWPDDNSEWVEGPDMRLGPLAKDEALVLRIWGQKCCDRACDLHGRKRVAS